MGYRVFVDENLDPQVALFLRMRGHDAIHVKETLGKGTDDAAIAAYAREGGYAVLTSDEDFLRSERNEGLTVFYCPEETVQAAVIGRTGEHAVDVRPPHCRPPAGVLCYGDARPMNGSEASLPVVRPIRTRSGEGQRWWTHG